MAKVFFGSDAAGAFVAARRFCKPAIERLFGWVSYPHTSSVDDGAFHGYRLIPVCCCHSVFKKRFIPAGKVYQERICPINTVDIE